ncbi:MAG: YfiR family protein [Pseudomonadales bacterium]|nr:YfiR family protein [Pseudomonadales bacterium]
MYQSLWYAMNGLLFALILTVPMANASDLEYQKREHQAKALFLYNFANFVEWPTEAFEKPKDPITLCLFGNIPFGNFLDSVNGTLIGERPLTVQRTQDMADIADGCHILFVGDEQRVLLPEFWNQIKYLYVLSVGEQNQFTQRGGIINILRTTDRVQFDVNISNAIANGLFISSDLLALARTIRENTRVRH